MRTFDWDHHRQAIVREPARRGVVAGPRAASKVPCNAPDRVIPLLALLQAQSLVICRALRRRYGENSWFGRRAALGLDRAPRADGRGPARRRGAARRRLLGLQTLHRHVMHQLPSRRRHQRPSDRRELHDLPHRRLRVAADGGHGHAHVLDLPRARPGHGGRDRTFAGCGTAAAGVDCHNTTAHFGSNTLTCTSCHGVVQSGTNPGTSAHHGQTVYTAPATCTDCHTPAKGLHTDFVTGLSCTTCHGGYDTRPSRPRCRDAADGRAVGEASRSSSSA